MNDWSNEETNEPLLADHRNFYKVERWSKDEQRARAVFREAIQHRPRGHYTIRQRVRVIEKWPL